MIDSKDISVIVQGAINTEYTQRCIISIRKYLPNAEIILSTWEDANTIQYEDLCDVIIKNKDPGASVFTFDNKKQNQNRQIFSTINGLKKSSRKYSLKLRSDMEIKGTIFLSYFAKYPFRNEKYKILKERVLINNLYTRNPYSNLPYLFHPSDWVMFGLTEDLINIWDIPLAKEPDFSQYLKLNEPINNLIDTKYCFTKYHAEQYIWISFLRKNHINIDMKDWTDYKNNDLKELSMFILINNSCVLDYISQLDIVCLKYPKYDKTPVMFNWDWQFYYKKYCDKSFKISRGAKFYKAINSFQVLNHLINLKKYLIRARYSKKEKYLILFNHVIYCTPNSHMDLLYKNKKEIRKHANK